MLADDWTWLVKSEAAARSCPISTSAEIGGPIDICWSVFGGACGVRRVRQFGIKLTDLSRSHALAVLKSAVPCALFSCISAGNWFSATSRELTNCTAAVGYIVAVEAFCRRGINCCAYGLGLSCAAVSWGGVPQAEHRYHTCMCTSPGKMMPWLAGMERRCLAAPVRFPFTS